MVRRLDVAVELSGGIRDDASLEAALGTGCARVNLGTAALESPDWVRSAIARHGDRIAVGLDVRGTTLAARGWTQEGGDLWETMARLDADGCARYVVTDVHRDGTLTGPNLQLLRDVCARTSAAVVASGGVSSLDDLRAIAGLGTGRGRDRRQGACTRGRSPCPRRSPPCAEVATPAEWLEGARPRTLFLAVAPVIAGTGVAAHDAQAIWTRALLSLVVALALQVGVNYANDYSDGVRGTDAERVGPLRLVGSGAAAPRAVLAAALAAFAVAALGRARARGARRPGGWCSSAPPRSSPPGPTPAGRRRTATARSARLAVFVFFGLVAVLGTAYVQAGRVTGTAVVIAVPMGLLACAVLVANNLRDIPGDDGRGQAHARCSARRPPHPRLSTPR